MTSCSQNTSLVEVLKEELKLYKLPSYLGGLNPIEFDKKVRPLKKKLQRLDTDGKIAKLFLEDNVREYKVNGLYVRELTIPKGSVILSRVHKYSLVNIISKGIVIVIDSNGTNIYEAPHTFISEAGTQRLVFASQDSVWNTAHSTEATNNFVEELTLADYTEFLTFNNQLEHKE